MEITNVFFINPKSTEPIENGTLEFPFKTIQYAQEFEKVLSQLPLNKLL